MSQDEITREQARALIAEHGIVALEREEGVRPDRTTYELDHNQYFRLGDGRLLWRQDSDDQCGELWQLVVGEIETTASEIVDMSIEAVEALQGEINEARAARRDMALRLFHEG